MKAYILIVKSCTNCNKGKAYLKSREPIEAEIEGAKESIGGMFCITSHVVELELDCEGKEFEID